jgi:hypothetical protein
MRIFIYAGLPGGFFARNNPISGLKNNAGVPMKFVPADMPPVSPQSDASPAPATIMGKIRDRMIRFVYTPDKRYTGLPYVLWSRLMREKK